MRCRPHLGLKEPGGSPNSSDRIDAKHDGPSLIGTEPEFIIQASTVAGRHSNQDDAAYAASADSESQA